MNQFFNDHFFSLQDDNQFGSTVGRSTTLLALLKLSHYLFTASDCPDKFIRVLFIDFTKAFDLVSHNILLDKYEQYDFPPHVTIWSLDFLRNRLQYVSVGDGLSSVAPASSQLIEPEKEAPLNSDPSETLGRSSTASIVPEKATVMGEAAAGPAVRSTAPARTRAEAKEIRIA